MIRFTMIALLVTAPAVSIPISGAFVHADAALDGGVWSRLSHVTVSAVEHDGQTGTYEGIRIADVLADAGAPVGDAVRGAAAATFIRVSAQDGYSAIFSLAELQPKEPQCAPLFAEARNGSPLTAPSGPVQVIAPCDRTHARWVREVSALTVRVESTNASRRSQR